ncbi:hypothetical protein PROFUN_03950 [Planoprotostelium fungivorum]|uniref:Homeobox domain-containing protein n=1 Tax=Planoprotostelium fungivorum TaxID=1890364 RepID=A0A2P6MTV9_9EUKA|nr:hypothetical protein PROFUN_03950 [Planoprotostelium fungivorum]
MDQSRNKDILLPQMNLFIFAPVRGKFLQVSHSNIEGARKEYKFTDSKFQYYNPCMLRSRGRTDRIENIIRKSSSLERTDRAQRRWFSLSQREELCDIFKMKRYPTLKEREEIAERLKTTQRRVQYPRSQGFAHFGWCDPLLMGSKLKVNHGLTVQRYRTTTGHDKFLVLAGRRPPPVTLYGTLHWVLVGLTVAIMTLIFLGTVVVMVATVVQSSFPNVASVFTSSEHFAYNNPGTKCTNLPWPSRFRSNSNTSKDDPYRYSYCPWPGGVTIWRYICNVITIFGLLSFCGILARRSAADESANIWQNPRRIILDGHILRLASNDCIGQQQTLNVKCDMVVFVLMILLDLTMFLLFAALLGVVILRRKRVFDDHNQLDVERSFPISKRKPTMNGSNKDKKDGKKKKKSKFDKYVRK